MLVFFLTILPVKNTLFCLKLKLKNNKIVLPTETHTVVENCLKTVKKQYTKYALFARRNEFLIIL